MRLATLFSGIGAPEQGAMRVYDDVKMVFACEWDKFARQSFEANYDIAPEHFHKDVHDLDGTAYCGQVDVLVGGSPCQSFSSSGFRHGLDDDRGKLIYQYLRIVDEVMPNVIVYENVKGFANIDNGSTLNKFVSELNKIGYHCHYDIVNTKDYGVPQNRERLFIVGFLDIDSYFRFNFGNKHTKNKIEMKEIFGSSFECLAQRGRGYNKGGNFYEYAPTVTSSGWNYNHKVISSVFDPHNAKIVHMFKLQDFPCEVYDKILMTKIPRTQMSKQIGNSMSVNILEMIFKQIEKAQSDEPTGRLF